MGFDQLLDILKKAQARHPGFAKRLEEAEAVGRWPMAVGPAIAKKSRALRVDNSVLFVEVDHPIWKSELHYRKRQILDILNNGNGERKLQPAKEILKDLIFVDPRSR